MKQFRPKYPDKNERTQVYKLSVTNLVLNYQINIVCCFLTQICLYFDENMSVFWRKYVCILTKICPKFRCKKFVRKFVGRNEVSWNRSLLHSVSQRPADALRHVGQHVVAYLLLVWKTTPRRCSKLKWYVRIRNSMRAVERVRVWCSNLKLH
jgi:hypothetical protein